MPCELEIIEELRVAAEALGPKGTRPHVRLPFPTQALPRVLRQFVEEAAEAKDVPPECIATPAIATCAGAIGATCRILLNEDWDEPSVLWAVVLMESGSLKTPAYNEAVEPLRIAQELAEEKHARDKEAYRKAKQEYEAEATFWNSHAADDKPATPPVEPVEPTAKDLYTSDSTVEAVAKLLGDNPRGVALTRDELSGFFSSFGAYKGGRGGDEAQYREFYNAGTLKLNRAGGKRIHVRKAAVSIFGTCQPAVFLKAIGATGKGSDQVENGLASRFLIAAPASRPKKWRKAKRVEGKHYYQMVSDLLLIPMQRDANDRAQPTLIALEPEAEARFGAFVDEHGAQKEAIENHALKYHYSKLEGVAGRLALIFYLCDLVTKDLTYSEGVQERHMLAGIALARWYGREAQRVYAGYQGEAERERQELLEKIESLGGVIGLRDMSDMRRKWKDPEAAEMALRGLVRAGYGELNEEETGGRSALRFRLWRDAPPPGVTLN